MKKQLAIILLLFSFFSCSSVLKKEECKSVSTNGNLGNIINSIDNEPLIKLVDNEIVYLTNDNMQFNIFQIKDNNSLLTKLDNVIKHNNLISPGLPTSFSLDKEKTLFVASGLTIDSLNRDLYAFIYVRGEYARIIDTKVLNSEGFEGHPFFVGNRLYYTKEINGQWDIYYSDYENGNWTQPLPYTYINTNADEGFYSESFNKFLFSRKVNGKFAIFAKDINSEMLNEPYQLSKDYNSNFNNISPVVINNELFLSSDRPGGCGQFDIYRFDFCRKVTLTGNVISEFENVPLKGIVELYSQDSILLNQYIIPNNSYFEFDLSANNYYYLTYKNDCYNSVKSTNLFFAECNENADVVLQQDIFLPNYTVEFNFEEYDIPFFVTGYYRPNTSDNLKELKSLFKLGVITGKGNTSYIEYPDDKYHEYSYTIDSAFNEAIEYINDRLNNLKNDCILSHTKIVLDITGYSDPRDISSNKIYPGPDIYDEKGNVAVKNGAVIDNQLLSFIRAYYTGAYIKDKVTDNSNIVINMLTGGVDDNTKRPNDLKRRVKVSIRLETVTQ
ncbi:MAG: hypothetical protein WC121_01810 [Candidatus Kapaibacterium sp.]